METNEGRLTQFFSELSEDTIFTWTNASEIQSESQDMWMKKPEANKPFLHYLSACSTGVIHEGLESPRGSLPVKREAKQNFLV